MGERTGAHRLTSMAGVAGISTRTLMTIFVGVMGFAFLVEFGFHLIGLFGLEDSLKFLTVLIATEVPLWFCQVLLWDRGERTFGAWEGRLVRAVDNLERLGFLIEFVEPSLTVLKAVEQNLTDEERDAVRAVQFASTDTYIRGVLRTVRQADPDTVADIVANYEEARLAWRPNDESEEETR